MAAIAENSVETHIEPHAMPHGTLDAQPSPSISPSTLHLATDGANAALPKGSIPTSPHHANGESSPLGHNTEPLGLDSRSPSTDESSEAAPLGGTQASRPCLPTSPSRVTRVGALTS